jgi:pimeloyl-ACP methyl ester carboxylesterase
MEPVMSSHTRRNVLATTIGASDTALFPEKVRATAERDGTGPLRGNITQEEIADLRRRLAAKHSVPLLSPAVGQQDAIHQLTHTHVSVPTQYVEANGIRFAYRRFGQSNEVPLLFMQHFRGGMDHWDPAVTDGFAVSRPVVLFDNAGVAGSSGETPNTIDAMAEHAADFINALGLSEVDLLGFSIGGYVAQALALQNPRLIRRLILVGTGPRGGAPSTDPKYLQYATSTDPNSGESALEAFLYLFFGPSAQSQAAGKAFWDRRHIRTVDVDPPSSPQAMAAQLAAAKEWREVRGERYAELSAIKQPTLVVNGKNDIMIPTINSFVLSQKMPNAQLIIYPDSGHGSHFQFPELFVSHGRMFLEE